MTDFKRWLSFAAFDHPDMLARQPSLVGQPFPRQPLRSTFATKGASKGGSEVSTLHGVDSISVQRHVLHQP